MPPVRSPGKIIFTYVLILPSTEPPAGQLRLANATVANWTAGLFAEVAKMFPSSMISTGGDEVQTTCYDDDEETQRDLNATGRTLNEALTDFVHGTHGALVDAGKTPVVWEGTLRCLEGAPGTDDYTRVEMVLDFNLSLSKDTLVLCV